MLPTFFCRQQPAGYLKCIHMHAHTKSLPSGQATFQKMHTFAGIFFRWFYVYTCIRSFPPLPILPAFFRSRHTHRNCRNKKRCFRKPTAVFPAHRKKQKKNKEKQRVNKDKYTKIYKFYFQIKKIEKMDILQEQNEKKIKK